MLALQKSLDEPDTAHSLNSSLLDPLDLHLHPMESIDSLIIFPETAAGYISQVRNSKVILTALQCCTIHWRSACNP